MNRNPSTHCWICLATLRRLFEKEYWILSSISLKSRKNKFAEAMLRLSLLRKTKMPKNEQCPEIDQAAIYRITRTGIFVFTSTSAV